jgi:hypothetical protein
MGTSSCAHDDNFFLLAKNKQIRVGRYQFFFSLDVALSCDAHYSTTDDHAPRLPQQQQQQQAAAAAVIDCCQLLTYYKSVPKSLPFVAQTTAEPNWCAGCKIDSSRVFSSVDKPLFPQNKKTHCPKHNAEEEEEENNKNNNTY